MANTDADLQLETTAAGVLLPVRAQPRARTNAVNGVHDGRLKVSVTQAPERGKANAAIARVLADALGLKSSQITLHSGATASRKVLLVTGVTVENLRTRLRRHWGQ